MYVLQLFYISMGARLLMYTKKLLSLAEYRTARLIPKEVNPKRLANANNLECPNTNIPKRKILMNPIYFQLCDWIKPNKYNT